jgi:hypothetical protein
VALASDVTTLRSVVVVASLRWRLFAALASDVTTLRSVVVVASLGWSLFFLLWTRFGCGPSAPGRSAPRRMGDGGSSAIKDRGCALMAPR